MKKILMGFLIVFYLQNSFSQNSDSLNEIQKVIYNNENVQIKAEFPKGIQKFNEFILTNLKAPFDRNMYKDIVFSFIVEMDGSINSVDIISNISNEKAVEIKRIVKNSPKWLPAETEGYYVRSRVKFNLKF